MRSDKKVYKGIHVSLLISAALVTILTVNIADATGAKPRKLAGMDVSTTVTSSFGYGDNVFRGSTRETSSSFFSIKPVVKGVRETANQKFDLGYEGAAFAFSDSSDDNYSTNRLSANFIRTLNAYSDFSIGASIEDGSTIRGLDITEGSNGDVEGATDFGRKDFSLGYVIGSEKIGPSVRFSYNHTDLEFDNFDLINQGRDYKLDKFSTRLGYQMSVKTKLFLDLSSSDFEYRAASSFLGATLDNRERAISAGVSWRLSRLTKGEFSIGTVDKEFDNFANPRSLTTWNAQLEWSPTSRDLITIESFSRPFEQAGTGLFQDVNQTSLRWAHDLTKVMSLTGEITVGSVDFQGVERDDDYGSLNIGLQYRATKYSEWSLNYEYEEKDSNLSRFNFDTNSIFLSYAVSL